MAWIRSRDQKTIIDAHSLDIRGNEIVGWAIGETSGLNLGRFKTEASAIAEMDAIERWLTRNAEGVYVIQGDPDA